MNLKKLMKIRDFEILGSSVPPKPARYRIVVFYKNKNFYTGYETSLEDARRFGTAYSRRLLEDTNAEYVQFEIIDTDFLRVVKSCDVWFGKNERWGYREVRYGNYSKNEYSVA